MNILDTIVEQKKLEIAACPRGLSPMNNGYNQIGGGDSRRK
ncbi:MAG: hypothetical protein ABSF10_02680 [Verrucomicrobiota bacterium]|jgi:hypothetical protein